MNENTDRAHWVELMSFNTGLEADMARVTLEAADIPVMQKSSAPGIFGAGFQGSVTGGVTLFVPSPELERARELMDGDDGD